MNTVFREPRAWRPGDGSHYLYVCHDLHCAPHLQFVLWHGAIVVKRFPTLDEAINRIKEIRGITGDTPISLLATA